MLEIIIVVLIGLGLLCGYALIINEIIETIKEHKDNVRKN